MHITPQVPWVSFTENGNSFKRKEISAYFYMKISQAVHALDEKGCGWIQKKQIKTKTKKKGKCL